MNQAEVKIGNEGDVILELPTPPHIWQDESFLSPPKMGSSLLCLSPCPRKDVHLAVSISPERYVLDTPLLLV